MPEIDARALRWDRHYERVDEEIKGIVEQADGPVTANEIAEHIDLNKETVRKHLRRLRDEGEVEFTYERWPGRYTYG